MNWVKRLSVLCGCIVVFACGGGNENTSPLPTPPPTKKNSPPIINNWTQSKISCEVGELLTVDLPSVSDPDNDSILITYIIKLSDGSEELLNENQFYCADKQNSIGFSVSDQQFTTYWPNPVAISPIFPPQPPNAAEPPTITEWKQASISCTVGEQVEIASPVVLDPDSENVQVTYTLTNLSGSTINHTEPHFICAKELKTLNLHVKDEQHKVSWPYDVEITPLADTSTFVDSLLQELTPDYQVEVGGTINAHPLALTINQPDGSKIGLTYDMSVQAFKDRFSYHNNTNASGPSGTPQLIINIAKDSVDSSFAETLEQQLADSQIQDLHVVPEGIQKIASTKANKKKDNVTLVEAICAYNEHGQINYPECIISGQVTLEGKSPAKSKVQIEGTGLAFDNIETSISNLHSSSHSPSLDLLSSLTPGSYALRALNDEGVTNHLSGLFYFVVNEATPPTADLQNHSELADRCKLGETIREFCSLVFESNGSSVFGAVKSVIQISESDDRIWLTLDSNPATISLAKFKGKQLSVRAKSQIAQLIGYSASMNFQVGQNTINLDEYGDFAKDERITLSQNTPEAILQLGTCTDNEQDPAQVAVMLDGSLRWLLAEGERLSITQADLSDGSVLTAQCRDNLGQAARQFEAVAEFPGKITFEIEASANHLPECDTSDTSFERGSGIHDLRNFISCSDSDGDQLRYTNFSIDTQGLATGLTYHQVNVDDGKGGVLSVVVNVHITNSAPTCKSEYVTITQSSATTDLRDYLSCQDVNGDDLTYSNYLIDSSNPTVVHHIVEVSDGEQKLQHWLPYAVINPGDNVVCPASYVGYSWVDDSNNHYVNLNANPFTQGWFLLGHVSEPNTPSWVNIINYARSYREKVIVTLPPGSDPFCNVESPKIIGIEIAPRTPGQLNFG